VWFSLAAAQGNPIAEDNRDELARVMTAQQRSEADLQVANRQREVNARMQSASKAGGPAEPKAAEEEVADLPIEPASETATGAPPKPQVFRVQLGAFKVPENAPAVWQELKRTHPDLLKGLQPDILRVDRGTKGALLLLRVGPLANAQSADELCNSLNERDVDCLVVRNRLKTLVCRDSSLGCGPLQREGV
jgi:cell division septation protein DedD